jgi:Fe-S-cluster containining protein
MRDDAEISAWRLHAEHPLVTAFFLRAREEIADTVRVLRPLCLASGACCRFEEYGHRMYLSGLEAAFVVRRIDASRAARARNPLRTLAVETPLSINEVSAAQTRGDCPYLQAGHCDAHTERPLGCRIFFCDKGADGLGAHWQSDLYERTHKETLVLHEALALPYRYLEWREALLMLAQ